MGEPGRSPSPASLLLLLYLRPRCLPARTLLGSSSPPLPFPHFSTVATPVLIVTVLLDTP